MKLTQNDKEYFFGRSFTFCGYNFVIFGFVENQFSSDKVEARCKENGKHYCIDLDEFEKLAWDLIGKKRRGIE